MTNELTFTSKLFALYEQRRIKAVEENPFFRVYETEFTKAVAYEDNSIATLERICNLADAYCQSMRSNNGHIWQNAVRDMLKELYENEEIVVADEVEVNGGRADIVITPRNNYVVTKGKGWTPSKPRYHKSVKDASQCIMVSCKTQFNITKIKEDTLASQNFPLYFICGVECCKNDKQCASLPSSEAFKSAIQATKAFMVLKNEEVPDKHKENECVINFDEMNRQIQLFLTK